MNFAVVVFPGSNSDHDAFHAASAVLGERASLVWHKDTSPGGCRCGDPARRLRPRRLPAHRRDRPLLADHGRRSRRFAERGGPVLGICNGFQVLLEAGLLPGAMVRNRGIKFVSRIVPVRVEADRHAVHAGVRGGPGAAPADRARRGQLLRRCRTAGLARGEPPGGVPLRRRRRAGRPTIGNPNGSVRNIAGICNAARNVVGLMPHPERASEPWMGSADGRVVLASVVKAYADGAVAGRDRRPGRRRPAHDHRHRPGRAPPARPHRRASTRASRNCSAASRTCSSWACSR